MPGPKTPTGNRRKHETICAVVLVGLLLGGVSASRVVVAQSAPDQTVVELWPAGQGRIGAAQSGVTTSCDFEQVFAAESVGGTPAPCEVTVAVGTPVTLSATPDSAEEVATTLTPAVQEQLPDFPAAHSDFKRWTVAGCGTTGDCVIIPDADSLWVGAIFTPLELEVGINGPGTVGVQDAPAFTCSSTPLDFGERTCHGLFAADASVVVNVQPTQETFAWGDGCVPPAGASTPCTVPVNNIRTFAAVAFGANSPPPFPFLIATHVRVVVAGSGSGVVTGSGLDCRSKCAIDPTPLWQDQIELEATADPGSQFVGWQGVCSTDPVCSFNAGSATLVEAVFNVPQPKTTTVTVPTTTTSTTSTIRTSAVLTTTTTTTVTTANTVTTAAAFTPRLQKIGTRHSAGQRLVVVTALLDRPARAILRLSRRGRTIVTRTLKVRRGQSVLQLRIPKSLKPGRCQLTVRFVAAKASRTIRASLTVGR
jgi:hypothetical protein